jgi:hypothetical protein
MKRILFDRPASYNLAKLAAEMQAEEPRIIAVNEVDTGATGVKIAVYVDDSVTLDEQALTAIVVAHDPTPPAPEPPIEQRVAEAEEALSVLFDELAALRPGGDN